MAINRKAGNGTGMNRPCSCYEKSNISQRILEGRCLDAVLLCWLVQLVPLINSFSPSSKFLSRVIVSGPFVDVY